MSRFHRQTRKVMAKTPPSNSQSDGQDSRIVSLLQHTDPRIVNSVFVHNLVLVQRMVKSKLCPSRGSGGGSGSILSHCPVGLEFGIVVAQILGFIGREKFVPVRR
jgi:hypothetical protein